MELLFTSFLMGLLGAGHCVAMCGSLSMAVGFSIPNNRSFVLYALFISLGRVLGYGLIGLLASFFSLSIIRLTQGNIHYLSLFAAILMFGVGLHIANISNLVLKTEKLGVLFAPLLNPIKKKLLPINSLTKCLAYGLFWGFLPCGLVYTALSLAITSTSLINGGLVMLFFGLGTLPALIGLTAFNAKLNSILSLTFVRLLFAVIVIGLAVYQFVSTLEKLQYF